ncbi:MAG TPA: phospholipase D-like domain-containing protein [Woeseiaceae bacterium]|nr:phospholipase D-like domain-containing protein [Woeseiaceae bacterium]
MIVLVSIGLTALVTLVALIILRRRKTPDFEISNPENGDIRDLLPVIAGLTSSVLYRKNEVSVLQDATIFDAMLEDIDAAKEHIHFETFVWSDGVLAERFADRLGAKAAEGVVTRLLLDAVGANSADPDRLEKLRQCGVEIAKYRPLRPWNVLKMNHRTHRKLLIVDGTIGYCFGHGIGDEWYRPNEQGWCWRDTGVRITGPAVHGLQQAFLQNWLETTHRVPMEPAAFSVPEETGAATVHIVSSAPGDSFSEVALIFALALAAARKEVLLQNPYFVPDSGMIACITNAARRGVCVKLMLPGSHTDAPIVTRAGRHLYAGLCEAGVELYEFRPTLCHQKIVVVDDCWSLVGSTNMDARSLELNGELSVGIESAEVAAELKDAFNKDLEHCRRIGPRDIAAVPWHQRWFNSLAYRFHEQL